MKNFICVALGFLLMSVCQGTPSLAASSTAEAKDTLLLDEHPELLTPGGSLQQRAATPSAEAAGYKVRIVYLVPSNRIPQPDAEKILQEYVETIQGWFRDQMERLGYAPKTFAIETAADGVTPMVHVAYAREPDTFFHVTDYVQRWNRILFSRIQCRILPVEPRGSVVHRRRDSCDAARWLLHRKFCGGSRYQF